MLSARLPTEQIARLLLALMLVCNLTLCVSWGGLFGDGLATASVETNPGSTKDTASVQMPACHSMAVSTADDGTPQAATSQGACQMQDGLASPGGADLSQLVTVLTLLALPLLLLPLPGAASVLLDNWLRDPFLRTRGSHPPSWPRRHLMLSVLRH